MDDGCVSPEFDDEALVARIARGDVAAFMSVYDRYVPAVYALAAHLLGRMEAEDVVQEMFLRLWDKAGQFDPQRGRFRVWFLAIVRHHVVEESRRRGRRHQFAASEEVDRLLVAAVDPDGDIEELAMRRERRTAVLDALKDLPDEQRRVLVLAYFGGLSQSAIARSLSWPLGTVKKRTRLAMQKLRASLARPASEEETPVASARGDGGHSV
ncbi:MAG: sigma-70 family RNA polymerase sigma factor [Dehalococcoidia bacterium]